MKKELKTILTEKTWIKNAYISAFDMLTKATNKTCLIMPTGSGKTLASAAVISKFNNLKVLYLAPNDYIINQTKDSYENFGVESDFMTYPMMHSIIKRGGIKEFEKYGLIILDEFHHLANKWGKSFRMIQERYPKIFILGLTATQIRYLDSGKDMSKELFNGNIAYKLSSKELATISNFKKPKYVIASDIDSDFLGMELDANQVKDSALRKQMLGEVLKLKDNWKAVKGVSGIIKKHLPSNLKKLLVFHESIDKTQEVSDKVKFYLKEAGYTNIKFYYANSGLDWGSCPIEIDSYDSQEEIEKFNRSDDFDGLKVLFSINMLNEGLHIKDCHAEIMLRSTMSRNVYKQQIGRVLSFGNENQTPIIIDLVKNIYLSNLILDQYNSSRLNNKKHILDDIEEVISEDFIYLIDETLDYRQLKLHLYDALAGNDFGKIDTWYEKYIKGENWKIE